jgi:hypothetical protein
MKLLGTAVAVAAALLLVIPATGQASTKSCPDGYVCVWTGKNYEGHKAKTKKVGEYVDYDDPIRNNISSIKNRWDFLTYFADGHQGHGASFSVCEGDSVKNLASYGMMTNLNNFAASAYLTPDQICGP